ncbi:PAS domain-containing protein [Streptomyces viridosporus]|uniref:PAS domain-containing protein n=1 Tax=Streptomyces viridosporus TaxID=67581 RepID=UPI003CC5D1A5
MAQTSIDYAAVYQALPGMVALLTPDLVFADVDEAYARGVGRSRGELVGRHLFDVFPAKTSSRPTRTTRTPRARATSRPRRSGSWPPASATPCPCSTTTSRTPSGPGRGRSGTGAR